MWWLLFLLPLCCCSPTSKFDLITADNPISGWMGSSVTLPCILTPALPGSLEVRWHRADDNTTPFLLYKEQHVQQHPADPQYLGRVSLNGQVEKGNLSLSIANISLVDNGEFICFVTEVHQGYEDASVHLIVKVRGSPPVLSVTDGGSGQVNVTCVSEGWYPQPTLTWRNQGGAEIPSHSDHSTTDIDGFVRVTSWLLYPPSESDWLSCSVGLSEEEGKESRILLYYSSSYKGLWKDIIMGILGFICLMFVILQCRKVCYAAISAGAGSREVVKIVLLGKTNVGKSATGNTILGRKVFTSNIKATEDKSRCEWHTREIDGRELYVIHTPSRFDTNATEADIKKLRQECIELTSSGLHAFLAINRLGTADSDLGEMMDKIQYFFGQDAPKYTVALFSHLEDMDETIEGFVSKSPELQQFVDQCGRRCHVLNIKRKNRSQVRELLKKIDVMVERNGGKYTIPEIDESPNEMLELQPLRAE